MIRFRSLRFVSGSYFPTLNTSLFDSDSSLHSSAAFLAALHFLYASSQAKTGAEDRRRELPECFPNSVVSRATPYPVALSP